MTRINSLLGALESLSVEKNEEDVIRVDVPLMIRLLEFAHEDAKDDMILHTVTERMIELCEDGKVLSMDDYDQIVGAEPKTDIQGSTESDDIEYADTKNKKYPIDEKHVVAAWRYIHQKRNAAKYTDEELKVIKGRIKAAAEKYGIELHEGATEGTDDKKNEEKKFILITMKNEEDATGFTKGLEKFSSIAKQGGDVELMAKSGEDLEDCGFKAHDLQIESIEQRTY